ncbi:MAG: hypothetical protein U0636_00345 [Phycisphaerales bacterium]
MSTPRQPRLRLRPLALTVISAAVMGACASSPDTSSHASPNTTSTPDPNASVNTVGQDRAVWMQLLAEHSKIRRSVVHTQEGDVGVVVATTESDDPAVAARIQDHAKAMKERMKAGAMVRGWDPVFVELFENHAKVRLEVTLIDKGVRIRESCADPETIALMRSHAMGVSDFVREGADANDRETSKLPAGGPLPASELAIGGVPHRFQLAQPDAKQVGELEAAALTDQALDQARAMLRQAAKDHQVVVMDCRSSNRTAPSWAAYRVLDCKVPMDQAMAEAKALQMTDPKIEQALRSYVARHQS